MTSDVTSGPAIPAPAGSRLRVVPSTRTQSENDPKPYAQALAELVLSSFDVERRVVEAARVETEMTDEPLLDVLQRWGAITPEQALSALALQHRVSVVDLRTGPPNTPANTRLSADDCRRLSCVPTHLDAGVLRVVTSRPTTHLKSELERLTGSEIDIQVASVAEINAAIIERELLELEHERSLADPIQTLISIARRVGANLVRIDLGDADGQVHFRVDGSWRKALLLTNSLSLAIRRAMHGSAPMTTSPDGSFGVLTYRTSLGEVLSMSVTSGDWTRCVVLEVPNPQARSLDDLHFDESLLETLRAMIDSDCGLIVIAGPADSGVPTTVRAILAEIDSDERLTAVVSADHSTQSRGVLRMHAAGDEDLLAALAHARMAQADVAVFTDVPSPQVGSAIRRFAAEGRLAVVGVRTAHRDVIDETMRRFGLDRDDIARENVLIIGQRLIRRVCESCAVEYHASDAELSAWEALGGPASTSFVHGVGCNVCADTGFVGRFALAEIASLPGIAGLGARTAPLVSSAVALVERRQTTLSELLRSFAAHTSSIAS